MRSEYLTDEQVEYYTKRFENDEYYVAVDDRDTHGVMRYYRFIAHKEV